jgi:8-oxo-dGTP pyrophosphatase MutT (NUDIX family)
MVGREILMLKNNKGIWDLPGGKLDAGETPEACCKREVKEETGLIVRPLNIVDAWVYPVNEKRNVFCVFYGCEMEKGGVVKLSDEHVEAKWYDITNLPVGETPDGFIQAIYSCMAAKQLRWIY